MDDSELHSIKEAKIFACTVQIFCVDGSRMAICTQVYVHKFFSLQLSMGGGSEELKVQLH